MKHTTLWHISPPHNYDSIMTKGLVSPKKNGYLYFVTDLHLELPLYDAKVFVPDIIGLDQIFIEEYDLYEIDALGIKSNLLQDKVTEFAAPIQKRVRQDVVEVKYIKRIERRKADKQNFAHFVNLYHFVAINPPLQRMNKEAMQQKLKGKPYEILPIPDYVNKILAMGGLL